MKELEFLVSFYRQEKKGESMRENDERGEKGEKIPKLIHIHS